MTSKQFDFSPYIIILLKRRYILLLHFILIVIVAAVYSFVIAKKQYCSQVVFLPPLSNDNTLGISSIIGFSAPSLFSNNIMPEQIETVFWSNELRTKIIDRFNLYENYELTEKKNRLERALRVLRKSLLLVCNEKGGFAYSKILSYSIISYHTSPDTARLMAAYAYFLVDSTVKKISINRANRNRSYVEGQLNSNKMKLDSLQLKFAKFQRENRAFDIPEQLKLSLGTYTTLKSEEIVVDLKLKALENDFRANTPEILDLKSQSRVLKDRLKKIESGYENQILPSLDRSTKLLPDYINMLRDLEVQNQLILLLSKEFEQAKLQELKDVSLLIILDSPIVPEYKAKPKRIFLMLMIIGPYISAIFLFVLVQEYFRIHMKNSLTFKNILDAIR